MIKTFYTFIGLVAAIALSSCVDEEEFADTPRGIFEALWKIMDERYCFFDYKSEEYGLDWDGVYAKYSPRISDGMTESIAGNSTASVSAGAMPSADGCRSTPDWVHDTDATMARMRMRGVFFMTIEINCTPPMASRTECKIKRGR